MRRLVGVMGLVAVGVLVGFVVRLVWPRRTRSEVPVYMAPSPSRSSVDRDDSEAAAR